VWQHYEIDATTAAVWAAFVMRDVEVNLKLLVFPNPEDDDAISAVISELARIDIICRD
jgi:hypothetical protein